MHAGRAAATAALVFLVSAAPVRPSARRDYGAEWRRLGDQPHILYVGGLQQGVFHMVPAWLAVAGDTVGADSVEQQQLRRLRLTPLQRRLIGEIARRRAASLTVDGFGTLAVSRVVSGLYADPANTFIPWIDMVQIAVMRLRGDSTDAVNERLRVLRAAAAADTTRADR